MQTKEGKEKSTVILSATLRVTRFLLGTSPSCTWAPILLLPVFLMFSFTTVSYATPISVDITWSTPDFGVVQGIISPVSGSASFTYDDTGLTGVGLEIVGAGTLTSLDLGGFTTIGATTFDFTNTGVGNIRLIDGVLAQYTLGGLESGVSSISPTTDDFWINHNVADPGSFWGTDVAFSVALFAGVSHINSTITAVVHNLPSAPEFSCIGFDSPFDAALTIKKKAKGTIPAKMKLFDENAFEITGADVTSPPVINVTFNGFIYGDGDTDDGLLESVGSSNDGNIFTYNEDSGYWEYRVGTKQFSANGTYIVDVQSGDSEEYIINPACSQTFNRLP